MKARGILVLHSVFFFGLVAGCLASPFFALAYPQAFDTYSLWVFVGLGIAILGSWYVYAGECPFTVWENNFRKKEGLQPYSEPCMNRYSKRWFGITTSRRFSDIFPIAILLIPILTRMFI